MPRYLLMRLEAPLMSFGTLAVDARRPIQRWPAASMLTGLLGNALGWRRTDGPLLDRLQQRMRWAARIDRDGTPLTDFQTAQLDKDDAGWTTRGAPESRAGGPNTFDAPHIRYCDFRADASVALALAFVPPEESPTIDELAAALRMPRRPLFIGRKCCAPAVPLLAGVCESDDAVRALQGVARPTDGAARPALFYSAGAVAAEPADIEHRASDERRFTLDVHAGQQTVYERWLAEVLS